MPTRRHFLEVTGALVAGAACAPSLRTQTGSADLVIRGGTVVDGTGSPGRIADVAISSGRIVSVGEEAAIRGTEEIDARGLVVSPGFIDIHSHADSSLTDDPRAESAIRQGITTIVAGQDGGSRATGAPDRSFAAYFGSIDELSPGCNVASMVGLGSVRGAVVGNDDRPATSDELARMRAMVAAAVAEGACGASSGLEYTPGAFAPLAELIALCEPLRARGLCYATHMRNEDDRVIEAIDEAIAVASGAGIPLHISHLKMQGPRNWNRLDEAFERIAAARARGTATDFDRYPYVAYSTGLSNLFPVWSRDGGTDGFLARLDDPAVEPRIRQAVLDKVALIGGWDNVQISSVREDGDRGAEGQRLGTWATARGEDPYTATLGLIRRNRAAVGMLGFAMSEDNLKRVLQHPLSMICTDGGGYATDGPTRRGSPHPRGIGSFARVLGQFVRDEAVLTLPDAVRKMTSAPAERLLLRDRGRVAPGMAADMVVFDLGTIADRATFADPFQYPSGVTAVIVNGAIALREGSRSDRRTGRSLRPSISRS